MGRLHTILDRLRAPAPHGVGAVVRATSLFMKGSLTRLDVGQLEREPARKVAVWIFSFGALGVLARRHALILPASFEAEVRFFAEFYGLRRRRAARIVGAMIHLSHDVAWRPVRDAGARAAELWLAGGDGTDALADVVAHAPDHACPRVTTTPFAGRRRAPAVRRAASGR